MTELAEVHITTDSREKAEKIATAAVEARVAACVQITGPIVSTYWWEGKTERSEDWTEELLILAKTSRDRLDALIAVVKADHSYGSPEIVAVPIAGGLADYLSWVTAETAAIPVDG